MTHQLVSQYQFTRQQFLAGVDGVSAEDSVKRLMPMNSISWIVGHLAQFDQVIWCEMAQGITISEAVKACANGKPASTPDLSIMLADWHKIRSTSDVFVNNLDDHQMSEFLKSNGRPSFENMGTTLLRQTWHYWYHLGEIQAIRQMLNHKNLPPFVGAIPAAAKY